MDPLTKLALAVVLGALAGGGLVWLLMERQALVRRVADLERRQQDGPAWAASMKLDHRAQLASIALLQEIATQDQLDALMRLSPEAVRRVVEKIAPHLFTPEDIQ